MTKRLIRAAVSRALRSRRGASVVEFALVATPFIFVLFAIIESGFVFVAGLDLSNATMAVARQIRVGSIMASGSATTTSGVNMSLADFKTAICNKMQLVATSTCQAQLQIDLRTQTAFGSAQTSTNPVNNSGFSSSSLCYNSGSAGSIVLLRAFYLWPITTPLLLTPLVNATSYTVGTTTTAGNYHVITAAEAFKVEQNSSGANSGSGC